MKLGRLKANRLEESDKAAKLASFSAFNPSKYEP
jgi:hypothetical protein